MAATTASKPDDASSRRRPGAVRCDIFCRVVDHYGDAAVCWRLALQLAQEHGWAVRLFIDDMQTLAALAPASVASRGEGWLDDDDPADDENMTAQHAVEVRHWRDAAAATPAQVVIEAFACAIDAGYSSAMRRMTPPPLWINLEYLGLEPWVDGCHGLPSPQPPLQKYFFFPGFSPACGGLLRRRDMRPPPAAVISSAGTLTASLFCYDNPGLPTLLDLWRDGDVVVHCHVAAAAPQRQLAAWLGAPLAAGEQLRCGNLLLHALPFLPQDEYDRLLDACDLNFVRGEDSFVRAQWSQRPVVWHAYLQDEAARRDKLEAFLQRYGAGLAPTPYAALRDFWLAWNFAGDVAAAWPRFAAVLPILSAHTVAWAAALRQHDDLAANLAAFCLKRL